MYLEPLKHLFPNLEPQLLEVLQEHSRLESLPQGTRLCVAGESADALFILLSGVARTFYLTAQAREFSLGLQHAPALLGVEGVFSPTHNNLGETVLLEDSEVLQLEMKAVLHIATAHPSFTLALLGLLADRHNTFACRVSEMIYSSLEARLARLLLSQSSGWQLPTNSLLAAELGTVPELVSRKLGEFYRAGYIRLEKRRIWVVQPLALEALLN